MQRLSITALVTSLCLVLTGIVSAAQAARDDLTTRGSRIGYSDGFVKGVRDRQTRTQTDFRKSFDYQAADRGYSVDLGSADEYRTVYRRSYEIGYNDGFAGAAFDSSAVDTGTARATAPPGRNQRYEDEASERVDRPTTTRRPRSVGPEDRTTTRRDDLELPPNLRLRIEMLSGVSTRDARVGDKLTARVVSPNEYRDAIIEGRVAKVKSAGRIRGTSELGLTFDTITLDNGQGDRGYLSAQVEEVYDVETSGQIDEEGRVKGKTTRKRDAVKIGGGAAAGAVLGGLLGGGAGAAVGAAVGAAAGATSVLTSRGEEMEFPTGTELIIRTASR